MFNQVDFMKEFIACETLSDVECRILIKKYREGDFNALELLIKGFSKMIISFIPFNQRNLDIAADKYQNGVIGIVKAANEFDLKSETKFSTYAFVVTKRWVGKTKYLMQLPSELWKAAKEYEAFMTNHSDHLTDKQLCDQLMVLPEELNSIKNAFNLLYMENIDDISSNHKKAFEDDISDYVIAKVDADLLFSELELLEDKRLLDFVKMHLGIDCEPQSFQAIGDIYGISKQRVQILFKRAMSILKKKENIIELAKEYL